MKHQQTKTQNPYATNKGGKIESLFRPGQTDPKATRKTGDDLRR